MKKHYSNLEISSVVLKFVIIILFDLALISIRKTRSARAKSKSMQSIFAETWA